MASTKCIVCDEKLLQVPIVKSKHIKTFCNYFSPSSIVKCDDLDIPFCTPCRSRIEKLTLFHEELETIRQNIQKIVSLMTCSIAKCEYVTSLNPFSLDYRDDPLLSTKGKTFCYALRQHIHEGYSPKVSVTRHQVYKQPPNQRNVNCDHDYISQTCNFSPPSSVKTRTVGTTVNLTRSKRLKIDRASRIAVVTSKYKKICPKPMVPLGAVTLNCESLTPSSAVRTSTSVSEAADKQKKINEKDDDIDEYPYYDLTSPPPSPQAGKDKLAQDNTSNESMQETCRKKILQEKLTDTPNTQKQLNTKAIVYSAKENEIKNCPPTTVVSTDSNKKENNENKDIGKVNQNKIPVIGPQKTIIKYIKILPKSTTPILTLNPALMSNSQLPPNSQLPSKSPLLANYPKGQRRNRKQQFASVERTPEFELTTIEDIEKEIERVEQEVKERKRLEDRERRRIALAERLRNRPLQPAFHGSQVIKKGKDGQFIYHDKWSFKEIESGFKCLHCPKVYKGERAKNKIRDHLAHHQKVFALREANKSRAKPKVVDGEDGTFVFGDTWSFSKVDGGYKCQHCDKFKVTKERMVAHMREDHLKEGNFALPTKSSERFVICDDGTYLYKDKDGDEWPFKKVDNGLTCSTCGWFKQKYPSMMEHIKRRHVRKDWYGGVKPGISVKLGNEHYLWDNWPYHKEGNKCWKCGTCGLTRAKRGALLDHIKSIHSKTHNFMCHICGKTFIFRPSFREHRLRHENRRNKLCHHCGKAFNTDSELSSHKLSHTIRKPVKCDVCGKLISSCYYQGHRLAHDGILNFKCSLCERKYRSALSLQQHKKVHNEAKDFHCDRCPRAYVTLRELMKHWEVDVHSEDQVEQMDMDQPAVNEVLHRNPVNEYYSEEQMAVAALVTIEKSF